MRLAWKGSAPLVKLGGSLLVMAIVGGAALTPVMGLIAERTGSTAFAYVVPLAGFLVVAAYARYVVHAVAPAARRAE